MRAFARAPSAIPSQHVASVLTIYRDNLRQVPVLGEFDERLRDMA